MYDSSATAAIADARRNAMVRAGYEDTSPADPDVLIRESIRTLEPIAPSSGVAAALLNAAAVQPVPWTGKASSRPASRSPASPPSTRTGEST